MFRFAHHRRRAHPALLRKWVARGDTLTAIAKRVGCSHKTMRRVLSELGLRTPRAIKSNPPPRPAKKERAGWHGRRASCNVPDAEREALEFGDVDEARAEAVFARRFAAVAARRRDREHGGATSIGEGDAADELEKRLRRDSDGAVTCTFGDDRREED